MMLIRGFLINLSKSPLIVGSRGDMTTTEFILLIIIIYFYYNTRQTQIN